MIAHLCVAVLSHSVDSAPCYGDKNGQERRVEIMYKMASLG